MSNLFKGIFISVLALVLISIVGVPFLINQSYISNTGYMTVWGGSELLIYFGIIVAALGIIFIGSVAMFQIKKVNEMNDRLVTIVYTLSNKDK